MWIFLIIFIFHGINCLQLSTNNLPLSLKDQCIKLCQEEKLPVLHPYFQDNIENIICRSGCRLFDIRLGGGLDVSPALDHCRIGCGQRFNTEDETNICYMGCDRIASKVQNQIQKILVEKRFKKVLVMGEPEIDGVENDLLSDPSIKSQLEVGFNVDYKIPETHIRTMPIEDENQPTNVIPTKSKDTGDWLDCASKNLGIPKWILMPTVLGAVLIMVAIYFTLSMENRKSLEDDKLLAEVPEEKDVALLENDAFNVVSEEDKINVEFLPPPTYSEVSEVDNSEPPNYEAAVTNQNREVNA